MEGEKQECKLIIMKILIILLLICSTAVGQNPASSGYLLTYSNGAVSIGTQKNTAPLTVANFNTSFPTPQIGTMLHIVSDNTVNGRVSMDVFNNASFTGPNYQGRRARGSASVPTAATLDDILVAIGADGYGVDSFTNASVGSMNIRASGTFTNTSKPTYISFTTTPSGSITQAERFRIAATGAMRLNTYGSGTFTGTPVYSLQVDASGNIIEGGLGGSATWGNITGTLSNQTDLQTALNAKAPLASPTFTGTPVVPGYLPNTTTAGVGSSPTSSSTTTITHNLGRVPNIIRIYGYGSFTSNAAATATTSSIGLYSSSGNHCVYQRYGAAITTTQAGLSSNTFAVLLATGGGSYISGVIQNVTSTQFDIVWTETGTATAQVYLWEAQ